MASLLRWFQLCTVAFLTSMSTGSNSEPIYTVHRSEVSFEQALQECQPHHLATFTTQQELAQLLHILSNSHFRHAKRTFWVGLKKAKNQCVVPSLPLRGFRWTTDGGADVHESQWEEEPEHTCTSVRCAALVTTQVDGSTVTNWGLVPLSCKTRNPFICQLASRRVGLQDTNATADPESTEPEAPEPAAPERSTPEMTEQAPAEPEAAEPAEPEPAEPSAPKTAETEAPKPANPEEAPEKAAPEPSAPETDESEPPAPSDPEEAAPASREPEPAEPEPTEPTHPTHQGKPDEEGPHPGPKSGPRLCRWPVVPGARFLSLDPDNSSRIQVDCWSTVRLDLHCSGRPAVWHLPNRAAANLSYVCVPCGPGFLKDASGECADVDECAGPHECMHTCVNTVGSYTCVCTDLSGQQNHEDSAECAPTETGAAGPFSGVLVPTLVAVALLVVLVAVVLVTLKCCLRRRAHKHREGPAPNKMAT
ncbi:C-type lectin domain family 14 member A [Dunckerocampus dactyliophorus]|uniref:C-type lectin domain family 14 member A n=1 Tax=Dunckerocampus dactyliophorus TaxID=161453 RepID=UPI0024065E42|nr:C-type lectin domain family 14 member A [Dunckerocampus dactyliophorus]XP_054653105.1 C-type lectin domain family 14 member A [Dunckerocampus dactyliophorus]